MSLRQSLNHSERRIEQEKSENQVEMARLERSRQTEHANLLKRFNEQSTQLTDMALQLQESRGSAAQTLGFIRRSNEHNGTKIEILVHVQIPMPS